MSMFLVDTLQDLVVEPMKKGYGRGLLEAGKNNLQIVALSSDVVGSTGTDEFTKEFPERFIEVGIAEQNLVAVASGMAAMNKVPVAAAYAAFMPGRCWEQIRTTICINDRPVVLVGTHAGISDAPDAATHQMLEDIAIMRSLPNMVVVAPCDSEEARKAIIDATSLDKPIYIRIARDDTPIITTTKTPFIIGKANVFKEGSDITIISTGRSTYHALLAASILDKDNINAEIVHCSTIKPLDESTILKSVKKTGKVVVTEEHQITGGLGGAVAELLGEEYPVPMRRVGVKDRFGESGKPDDLLRAMGLTPTHIAMAAHQLIG
ncbi:transketolase family protein [Candidatus Nomurabacteria bacterium]|nr:transketolase family protein [Candidatus Nomurabacteria bacterium]